MLLARRPSPPPASAKPQPAKKKRKAAEAMQGQSASYIDMDGSTNAKQRSVAIDYGFSDSESGDDGDTSDGNRVAPTRPLPRPEPIAAKRNADDAQPPAFAQPDRATEPFPLDSLCVARWSDDGLWYDARVVALEPAHRDVRHVVFDNFESEGAVRLTVGDLRVRGAPSRLIVLRGPSGSGKSTAVRQLLRDGGLSFSTDDFFVDSATKQYNFDASRIQAAHEWNQKRAIQAINEGRSPIVIDNTNLEAWEPVRVFCVG